MKAFKFFAALVVTTLLMSTCWETLVKDRVYRCTDSGFLDYFSPGDWIHGNVTRTVAIDRAVSMSSPDQLIAGWTTFGIWLLWVGMVATSILVSYLVSVPRLGASVIVPNAEQIMDGYRE